MQIELLSAKLVEMMTSTRLKSIIDQHEKDLVVIHFCAKWSGCAFLMNNVLKDLIPKYQEQVEFLEIDVEEDQELVQFLSIVEIPTLIFFNSNDYSLEGMYTGIFSKHRLKSELDAILTKIQTIS